MCEKQQTSADVQETALAELDKNILLILLKDHSTGKNILWATDDYKDLGIGFAADDEITLPAITGANGNLIKPRALKSKEEQGARTRNMAEVFTPLWICNKQNNLADNAWFGRENVFNTENGTDWQATDGKIAFPGEDGTDGWRAYIGSKRLEITCGEAPYLASRYDTMTGEIVPLAKRIGLLDRKLRVINERTRNFKDRERAKKRWLELATLAVRSIYGFEWAGDNILLARENLLFTVADYYAAKFGDALDMEMLEHFAEIISWNIWQMDGLKAVVPNSCHDYKKERQAVSPNLFLAKDFSARTLKRSVSPCDVDEDERQKCQGCLKDNIELHNGVYCRIKNWSTGKVLVFKDMLDGEGSEGVMSKDFKFDVVIGNPPYQVSDGGSKASAKPVYHLFVESVKKINPSYMSIITPTRWFAGGKGLDEFRNDMLNDKHIRELHDWLTPEYLFPNTNIRGGVCYFLWDREYDNQTNLTTVITHDGNNHICNCKRELKVEGIDIFIRYAQALTILKKVKKYNEETMDKWLSPRKPFGIESSFSKSSDFTTNKDAQHDVLCFAKGMKKGYIKRELVLAHKEWIDSWKVYAPRANNIGTELNDDNLNAFVGEQGSVCTEAYLAIGINKLDSINSAYNLAKYLKTKFARFMHCLAKASQDATSKTYCFIPVQDFSNSWTDEMLYKKYNLTDDEIAFIDSMIKPME